MEPTSLAFGVIALASLFSTCIGCFEYISTAKSFSKDFELLLVKFDVQKERLLTWGELVGISNPEQKGFHKTLRKKETLVKRCLSSVHRLFRDGLELEQKYGLRATSAEILGEGANNISSNRTKLFRRSYKQMNRVLSLPSSGLQQKTQWVIHDKCKFEVLIAHVRDLVDNLHELVPVSTADQHALVCRDMSTLQISKLKVVRRACAGTYQSWSDAASMIITTSEPGTADHRSIGNWIQDTGQKQTQHERTPKKIEPVQHPTSAPKVLKMSLPDTACIYFVFTGACLLLDSDEFCSADTIGISTFATEGISFLPESENMTFSRWSVGRRISDTLQLTFRPDDVEMLRYANFELGEIQGEVMSKLLPLGTMYVFCGPCVCALRTALLICASEQSKTLHCLVRVDDRIDTSCCQEQHRLDCLESIIDAIKTAEAMSKTDTDDTLHTWTQLIDRVWLEQRIYALEEAEYDSEGRTHHDCGGSELFAELRCGGTSKTAFVILGELDTCQWMLQTSPFPWRPRMPKENEIYQLRRIGKSKAPRWTRTFLGTFTPRLYHLQSSLQTNSRKHLASSELHTCMASSAPRALVYVRKEQTYADSKYDEDESDAGIPEQVEDDEEEEEQEQEQEEEQVMGEAVLQLPKMFVFRGRNLDTHSEP